VQDRRLLRQLRLRLVAAALRLRAQLRRAARLGQLAPAVLRVVVAVVLRR
jgi:hypothetical protein